MLNSRANVRFAYWYLCSLHDAEILQVDKKKVISFLLSFLQLERLHTCISDTNLSVFVLMETSSKVWDEGNKFAPFAIIQKLHNNLSLVRISCSKNRF